MNSIQTGGRGYLIIYIVYCIGVFKWESTNQTLDELYTNWGEGEPNNHDDREDCAEFR